MEQTPADSPDPASLAPDAVDAPTQATPAASPDSAAAGALAGEEGQGDSIDHRRERIRVETPRHCIEGNVTLARDGFRSRASDMLNASERDFLILTDATVAPIDGGAPESHRFLAVSRRHIVFAVLADASE